MKDLSLMIDDVKFNFRVATIIRNGDKVLLHKADRDNFYVIPGGRVKVGEDTETAIKREMFEEMGENIIVKKYVGTIENFFVLYAKTYHEILIIYEAEFDENSNKNVLEKFRSIERDDLEFIWKPIDDIKDLDLRPNLLKDYLLSEKDITHIVNKD